MVKSGWLIEVRKRVKIMKMSGCASAITQLGAFRGDIEEGVRHLESRNF